MNLQRFLSMPNGLKPMTLTFLLLTMLLAAAGPDKEANVGGGWFFWLTIFLQIIWMFTVCALFLYEAEAFLSCGRDAWPIVEMSYSGVFGVANIINIFIVSAWHEHQIGRGSTLVVAAMTTFMLVLFYALSGFMMFRIWRGFVKSGASQNPTPNLQPGNVGGMHPGI
ncbi:hypothetical protein Ddc_09418 [Ditylenchus destructor]|nr:hypothetical protein Ddc_09418 [Ditylenchus destructor]